LIHREALAAIREKEEYQRRHMAGETEQAKRELAQLAEVRRRREAAAKKREAEGRAPGWTEAGIASSEESDDDGKPRSFPLSSLAAQY
jgi:rhodanese-related sulfurtransferase